ncbi:MAG: endo-1,4-beta-xylanase [Lachnospiraceae bacterium]|nr:endo-1,4-beta-xylanase [Lachnospiraceae bacterium]
MPKKLIKKGIALIAAVCMITGCAGNDTPEADATPPAAVQETIGDAAAQEEPAVPAVNGAEDEETEDTAEEVPVLRDAVRERSGAFAGCAVTGAEIDDPKVWDIITTHFERVTLGNELKPDCMFGYSVAQCPGTETDTLNGEDITVPRLDHSRADRMLDLFLKWNEENPDRKIMIRGHVLVWHSQTPEWFFHEDYDKNRPYVSAREMDKRLEWYIKSMLTYYTGEDSRYKELFYGWDVVNEAISDGTGTYRTETENPSEPLSADRHGSNSSWWAVYKSNEFIINAFKYANKYAPAELELYYNDYNECVRNKKYGIIELLKEIKAQEGAPGEGTRISAMGMQGHYGMEDPSTIDIQSAIKQYAEVVGKVQLTEVDIRASEGYNGSEEAKAAEYEKLEKRYNVIWNCVKNADGEVEGITFWGTVDHYSWLQSRSDVGGGSKTGLPQCPLLFDENYEPKPCFYPFTK